MKKTLCAWLLAACVMMGFACAEEIDQRGKEGALSLLTEVYGYTTEETATFQFETAEKDGAIHVKFYPFTRPDWVYTGAFNSVNGQFVDSTTPFTDGMELQEYYPGESAIRSVLRRAAESQCFTYWDGERRTNFVQWMQEENISPNHTLMEGVVTGNLTGAQALHAFFESCYGPQRTWTKAVQEWYELELFQNQLKEEPIPAPEKAAVQYTYQYAENYAPITVTRFIGEAPDKVKSLIDNPNLAGWQPICGVLQESQPAGDTLYRLEDSGMMAFEKDGKRLLVTLQRRRDEAEWRMYPVSQTALRTDVDMYIQPGTSSRSYQIVYPLSDTEKECFLVRSFIHDLQNDDSIGCSLLEYSRFNAETGEGIWIDVPTRSDNGTAVVYHADGRVQKESIQTHIPNMMENLNVEDFPTTLNACWQYKSDALPAGYGVSRGVHLRRSTSSRSKDLGMYEDGVLVKILSEESGDPYNWYRVQVGSQQGYMSSAYVYTDDATYANAQTPLGKTTREAKLKNGTGWFAKTIETLPAQTRLYLLADCGDAYHVMLMESNDLLMPTQGTDGYLPKDAVTIAYNSLQLDWQ